MTFFKTSVIGILLSLLGACSLESENDSLESIYETKKGSYPLYTRHLNEKQEPLFLNRLIKQDSLYLLQHANNPVQWWPWGNDAFAKANQLNKPIFLSIGYSTCHWCHVMARESFEDIQIANFINENFIPVKVDREEYPDVDELYLTSVQMLSGKAGWPLTAVLTPDGQAFFGGTYFQPSALLNVLNKINDTWAQRQDAVLEQASRLTSALSKINESSGNTRAINNSVISEAAVRIQADLTSPLRNGGNRSKPGFPREPEMLFLLSYAQRNLSESIIDAITHRLQKLAAGGIHDQVGGGFHRYTVDSDWVVPHFEKMLYNQAQMGKAYFLAYQLSANQMFRKVGDKTFEFLLREMQAPEGGFYSAMDAESERADGKKGEGEYYIWTQSQLSSILTETELSLAKTAFGITSQGNFNGSNVLQNTLFDPNQPEQNPEHATRIKSILNKLTIAREQRTPPRVDTKIITSWNAMAISALAAGHNATNNGVYLQAAKKAANRLWHQSYDQRYGLSRTIPSDEQRVAGTLEDYAYFANALIDLYDIDADKVWLERSEQIVEHMMSHFHDKQTGGFQISNAANSDVPILKLITARDDAIYSGNSVAAQVLARMLQRTGKVKFKHAANNTISAFSNQLLANPEAISGMLLAANMLNNGDIGVRQYAAKGNVTITTNTTQKSIVNVDISIAEGWHINASKVLNEYQIPTSLKQTTLVPENKCQDLVAVNYPEGKLVSLGFQEDKLLVYENSVTLSANRSQDQVSNCKVLAAELNIQACTNEVCLAPETVQIRAY